MKRSRTALRWPLFILSGPALLVAVKLDPIFVTSSLVLLALTALAAIGLTLIMGYAGQVSLGHAAFFGAGAYTVAIATTRFAWPAWLGLLAVVPVAGALAALLGRLVFRLQGHVLAMATLAFGLVFYYLVRAETGLTGGNNGIGGIPGLDLGPLLLATDDAMFVIAWAGLGVGIGLAERLVDSATGRALRAVGASEIGAAGCGIDVARTKITIFIVGAIYAALGGGLYALFVTYVSPESFGVLASIEFVVISTVGGMTSVWGAPIGALAVVTATELARQTVPLLVEGGTGSYEIIAYGLALIVVLLVADRGPRLRRRQRSERPVLDPARPPAVEGAAEP